MPIRRPSLTTTLAAAGAAGLFAVAAGPRLLPVTSAAGAPATLARPRAARAPATTATTAAPTTTAPAPAAEHVPPGAPIDGGPKGLATGAKGPAVSALEERLALLRFNPGKVDGAFDAHLGQAVMAFQKQQGLPRTGRADATTLAAVAAADLGAPAVPAGDPTRVEVVLPRQIAQFWEAGRLVRVVPVSTGTGARYCVSAEKGGGCDVAVTPVGSFRADRKIRGLRESNLGSLYDPVYFHAGWALHGAPSVPAGPASHGCVRVPMWESRWVHDHLAIGHAVYVVGDGPSQPLA